MNFLFPLAAWLGILALPVIAFYLLKTRQRRKVVPTLLFWNVVKPKVENSPFWRKLRRWLSLLLQLLILALVVAAIARPAFEWERTMPQQVVAVLDNSASMRAVPSRWEEARSRLLAAIARLRVQDEMAILTTEDPPRLLSGWTSGKRALREAVEAAPLLDTGTNPDPALALARELIAMRENARIDIYSDSVWPPAPRPGVTATGVDSRPPVNAGLTLFAVRRSPVAPGDWQLEAEVTSASPFTGRLEIQRDGQPMDLAPVEAAPDRPWRKTWRGSSPTGAELTATLQTAAGDLLAEDNRASCTLAPLRNLHVVVIGPPNPYLEAVLDSIPLVQWRRVPSLPAPAGTDLIIAGGAAAPAEPPPTPLLLLNPTTSGFWGEREGLLPDAPVTDLSPSSPLLRYVELGSVAIEEAGEWVVPPGSDVFAASLGHPLIFGRWDRSPRLLVVGFDPAKSDLPLRAAFPVLMGNLLQSLREDDHARAAAVLPGPVETALQPQASPAPAAAWSEGVPVFPGWWLVLLSGLIFVVAEWYLYNRRITD